MHHVTLRTNQSWEDCNVMCIICAQKTCSGWIWCFEDCMSSVMLLQVQQLYRAGHIVTSHETPSPPQTETQSTQNGEGETPDKPHSYQCWSFVSLSVSSSLALFLSISPVLIIQQHNWLHHVSEHHNCHIKHGWVCAHVYLCVCHWTCTALLKTTWMTFTHDI